MSGSPHDLSPHDPFDWQLYWQVGLRVGLPAVLGLAAAANTTGWLLAFLVIATLALVAFQTHAIAGPLVRTANRLRQTAQSLEVDLAASPASTHVAATGNDLVDAEEQLYAVCERGRSALRSQREHSRRLEQSSTLFEGVLETMQEAVLVVDAPGKILFINSAARDLFDVATSRSPGPLAWENIRSSQLQEIIGAALESGRTVRREVELPRRKRLAEVSAVVLTLADGPGCLAVAYDVTELRRLEKMRRDFVSNVSHELKTPLTSIQAYADTLLNGGLEDEDSSRMFVERIVEQSERLAMLIQDLLRLAKIESEPEAFQIEPCDAVAITSTAFNDHQKIAQTRQVRLEQSLPDQPVQVLADADGLRTILNNLLSNAIHYTPVGGDVRLSLSVDANHALFEVQDTGVGIAKEHQSRVFERFYRVDRSRARSVGGTGLGLAIVRHLVEVMSGEVTLESELGKGSTFRVRIPLWT